jgi:acyl dehydratase
MNFNGEPVYVGRDYGTREVTLDREAVDHYVDSVEGDPALYHEHVPALLLHSECYRDLNWYLANIFGNLHARQEWEMFAPALVGDTVSTRAFIRDRYRKRGRDYVVKETWMLGRDGRLLTRGITHQSFLVTKPEGGDVVDKSREKSKERVFEIGGRGTPLDPLSRNVHEKMCRLFSGPGDNYHTDRESARALGFPDIVVQGMLPICFVSELLTREFRDGWLAGGKMDVRLVNVLWAGERVTAKAEVIDEVPEAGRARVHLDVWVEKDDGTKVIVGQGSAIR